MINKWSCSVDAVRSSISEESKSHTGRWSDKVTPRIKLLASWVVVIVVFGAVGLPQASYSSVRIGHVSGGARAVLSSSTISRPDYVLASERFPRSHPMSGYRGRPVWSEAELKKWATGPREASIRVVHFKARLTVNGYPVLFDEFVICPHLRREAGFRKRYPGRYWLMKKLPDGSAVFTSFLPKICFNWQKSWAPIRTRGGRPVPVTESVPPKKFLMQYYWADDAKRPDRIEAYFSHAYHQQRNDKKRLILHSQTLRLAPYPAPTKIVEKSIAQAKADLLPIFLFRGGLVPPKWRTTFAVPMTKKEWLSIPLLRRAVRRHRKKRNLSDFDDPKLWRLLFKKKPHVGFDWIAFRYGIPHPGKEHHLLLPGPTRKPLEGITGGLADRTRETLDEVRPVDCTSGTCKILLNERGYLIFYPHCFASAKRKHPNCLTILDLEYIEAGGIRIRYRRPPRLLLWRPESILFSLNAGSL